MNRRKPDDNVLQLAQRIADGEEIEWSIEENRPDAPRLRLQHLRVLDSISLSHRRLLSIDLPFHSWGPLELRERIGQGGFGEVFRAFDRNLSRYVALKLLPGDADDPLLADLRFVEEARRLAGIRHPNVVTIHGVDRFKDRSGLWMEWLEGEDLGHALTRSGPFGDMEAASIGVEICRALSAVHQAGLVHRDVKLSNLFRERGGRIVLMDFGSSTRQKDQDGFDDLNRLSGTPVYIAPESFEGIDSRERVDLYALGVTLYCLTCGEYPMKPGTPEEIRRQHRERLYAPLRDRNPALSPRFIEIVARAMNPDPAERYASAGEMEQDLSRFLGNVRQTERPRAGTSRRLLPALAAAAVPALAALALFVILPMLTRLDATADFLLRNPDRGTMERLEQGSRITPGDELVAELDLSHPAYVYILNEDSRGRQYLLFPVEGLQQTNPVPAAENVRIPKENSWVVDTAGGEETVLVVASREPIPFVEELIGRLDQAGNGEPILLHAGDDAATRLRGIGGLKRIEPEETFSASSLESMRSSFIRRAAEKSGVKIWEYRLRNPE